MKRIDDSIKEMMMRKPFKPKRDLKGRYYSWSEIAKPMSNYLSKEKRESELDDEDSEPTVRAILSGNALSQLYGRAAHEFIELSVHTQADTKKTDGTIIEFECSELTHNSNDSDEIILRWENFWRRYLIKKTRDIDIPSSKLDYYLEVGFSRGRRDMTNYIEIMRGKWPKPEEVEVLLENVRIRGTSFHLTVKVDFLCDGSGVVVGRKRITDLKFDNCTEAEFLERSRRYYHQVAIYALTYLDRAYHKGDRPALPVVTLLHVPTKRSLNKVLTRDDIAMSRRVLKNTEEGYRAVKRREQEMRVMLNLEIGPQFSIFGED
jgi:hypothetical protein